MREWSYADFESLADAIIGLSNIKNVGKG